MTLDRVIFLSVISKHFPLGEAICFYLRLHMTIMVPTARDKSTRWEETTGWNPVNLRLMLLSCVHDLTFSSLASPISNTAVKTHGPPQGSKGQVLGRVLGESNGYR